LAIIVSIEAASVGRLDVPNIDPVGRGGEVPGTGTASRMPSRFRADREGTTGADLGFRSARGKA
jgi:hypothetical protein